MEPRSNEMSGGVLRNCGGRDDSDGSPKSPKLPQAAWLELVLKARVRFFIFYFLLQARHRGGKTFRPAEYAKWWDMAGLQGFCDGMSLGRNGALPRGGLG